MRHNTRTRACEPCPPHSINPGQGVGCTNCSLQHYTRTDSHGDLLCLPCPEGSLRQASSQFGRCEPCPSLYFMSALTQQCQLCILPPDLVCPEQERGRSYVDDCSTQNHEGGGCSCGCRACDLHRYVGVVKNFMVLPGCQAACEDGYKLQHVYYGKGDVMCIENNMLLKRSAFSVFNNGQYKFGNTNASDFTVKPCYDFFALPWMQIESLLHIQSSLIVHPAADFIRVHHSILASYISNLRELKDIDKSCVFRCVDGFVALPSLATGIFECVPIAQPAVSPPPSIACAVLSPSFSISACTSA